MTRAAKPFPERYRGKRLDGAFLSHLFTRDLLNRYNVKRSGVIHLGGHLGEELYSYLVLGFKNILVVEPQPGIFERLEERARIASETAAAASWMLDSGGPDERISQIKCLQCAVSDVTGTIPFYQTGYTAGSSTEPLDKQAGAWDKVFPRRGSWYRRLRGYLRKLRALRTRVFQVPSRTLDDVLSSLEPDWGEFTYLRMNIQGAELRALRGAQRALRNIDIVDFDRIVAPRYGGTGAAPQETYDELMSSFGFERVVTIDFEVDWRVVYRRLTGGVTP